MEKDRVGFARIRAPEHGDLRVLDFLVGTSAAANAKNRRQTDDTWSMSGPVTTVDVVAAKDGAGKFLGDVVQFVRRFRTTENPKRLGPVLVNSSLESGGRARQRLVPTRGTKTSVFAHQRLRQSTSVFAPVAHRKPL